MDTKQYNILKTQVEEKYQKSLELAEKQRKEALEAIERVWNMLHDTEDKSATKNSEQPVHKTKKSTKYGDFTAAVKKALELVPAKFTKNDIKLVLPQVSADVTCNDASLTNCLIRFVKQGLIKVAKRGLGSLPTVYKKAI